MVGIDKLTNIIQCGNFVDIHDVKHAVKNEFFKFIENSIRKFSPGIVLYSILIINDDIIVLKPDVIINGIDYILLYNNNDKYGYCGIYKDEIISQNKMAMVLANFNICNK